MERWKKIIIIITVLIFVAGLAVGIPLIIKDVKLGKKLRTPQNLSVTSSGEFTYASCDPIEGALKYFFYVDDFEIEFTNNVVELSPYLNDAKDYSISIAVEGVKSKSRSDKSDSISFSKKLELNTPVLSLNEAQTALLWSQVENASSYLIFLNGAEGVEVTDNSFLISSLPTAGLWSIKVQAISTNPNYISSRLSNELICERHVVLSTPRAETMANGNIKIYRQNDARKYEIQINSLTFEIEQFDEEFFVFDYSMFDSTLVSTLKKIRSIGDGRFIENSQFTYLE